MTVDHTMHTAQKSDISFIAVNDVRTIVVMVSFLCAQIHHRSSQSRYEDCDPSYREHNYFRSMMLLRESWLSRRIATLAIPMWSRITILFKLVSPLGFQHALYYSRKAAARDKNIPEHRFQISIVFEALDVTKDKFRAQSPT